MCPSGLRFVSVALLFRPHVLQDSSVLENFHATFGQAGQPKYKAYIKPKKSADRSFVLNHYAGEVFLLWLASFLT